MGAAGQWCILRCCGRQTLPLAESLAGDGFEAWAPVALITPEQKEGGPPPKPRIGPLAPTYVFARAAHLWTLVNLAEDPARRHADFSVFRPNDRFRLIGDHELEPLRYEERKGVPPEQRRVFLPGEEVRVVCGSGMGKVGIVERAKGKVVWVDFGGSMRAKISAFNLQPIVADSGSTGNGAAAQAA
jgi:hypothetical protein